MVIHSSEALRQDATSILAQIKDRACAARPHIVLSEGQDGRVIEAGIRAVREGIAEVSVVASQAEFASASRGIEELDVLKLHDPAQSRFTECYAASYLELRRSKGCDADEARRVVESGLGFAAMMVRHGHADGTVGGAVETTANTVRTALRIIGRGPVTNAVSSCFLMLLASPFSRPVIFADCGLILQPTAEELADIAIVSARSFEDLVGETARVAMLSFSTKGSVDPAAHESIQRIRRATDLVRSRRPDLVIDGELQFDAAIMPEIAERKAPDSALWGNANVFIFPSLSAGNIGYKIAQRLGGAIALGPILQGLSRPANDLSRGCSVEDVYHMIAITGAQAAPPT